MEKLFQNFLFLFLFCFIININILKKPVESGSPLGWSAGGGQLGSAAVSLLYSLSQPKPLF
jgi:hypothetical protein